MTSINAPENFHELSNAIRDLSVGLVRNVTDWVDIVYLRENPKDGSILVSFSSMDADARKSEFTFALVAGESFSLNQVGGRKIPKDWNIPGLHRHLIEFIKSVATWQPVFALKFSPFMRTGQRYTPKDLIVSEFLDGGRGWVLNIRGVGNGFYE